MTTALICGVSGQDGAYLARHLIGRGVEVHGSSRDAQVVSFGNLDRLGIRGRVALASIVLTDFRSVMQALMKIRPDRIYNLAGQSSVGLSFELPVETLESIAVGTLNLLEAIRLLDLPCRFYNACSGECFGNTGTRAADEATPFHPRSPYGVAKATAFWEVANYREAYGLYACSGILFNHDSPLRPERFVTQKIVRAACRIAAGGDEVLSLGNTAVSRDWGWAPEYVEAMGAMLEQDEAEDYVIATGESHTLQTFVAEAFGQLGMDWQDHVRTDETLLRPADIPYSCGNADKARRQLGWQARARMRDVVRMMIEAEQRRLAG